MSIDEQYKKKQHEFKPFHNYFTFVAYKYIVLGQSNVGSFQDKLYEGIENE